MSEANKEAVHAVIESIDYTTNSFRTRVTDPGKEGHRSFHCEGYPLAEEEEEMIGQEWEVTLKDGRLTEMLLMSVEDPIPSPMANPPCSSASEEVFHVIVKEVDFDTNSYKVYVTDSGREGVRTFRWKDQPVDKLESTMVGSPYVFRTCDGFLDFIWADWG